MNKKKWSDIVVENREKIYKKLMEAFEMAVSPSPFTVRYDVFVFQDGNVVIDENTSNSYSVYDDEALLIASISSFDPLEHLEDDDFDDENDKYDDEKYQEYIEGYVSIYGEQWAEEQIDRCIYELEKYGEYGGVRNE